MALRRSILERETERAAAMRSGAVVFVMMVVATMGFFASESAAQPELGIALPSDAIAAEIITEAEDVLLMRKEDKMQKPIGEAEWPCCDNCGVCNKKNPPECKCNDLWVGECHPGCKKCVQWPPLIYPPRFYCDDWITNFCKRKCTTE